MDTEQFIHDCARRGLSKAETARTLGWTQYKMEKIVSVMGAIDWPTRGQSLGNKRGNESRRGICPAGNAKAREVRRLNVQRTAFGVTASVPELVRMFGKVSYDCTRNRMGKEGMTLEQALITPARPSARGGARKIKSV